METIKVMDVLHTAEKPTWGCRCVAITTPDRGILDYTCAPCTERARAALQAYENPHTDQLPLMNWGMF